MGATQTETIKPRIYVACLAAYSSGYLHGAWIDADQYVEAISAEITAMLRRSPVPDAEEYAIHDYEGFGDLRLSESTSIEEVARIAAFAAEHEALGLAVLAYFSGDLDDARQAVEERYLGCYSGLADFIEQLTEESTDIPDRLRPYIDWEAMARDAELSGDVFTVQTAWDEVHVFNAH